MVLTEDGSSSRDSGATSDIFEVACKCAASEDDDDDDDDEDGAATDAEGARVWGDARDEEDEGRAVATTTSFASVSAEGSTWDDDGGRGEGVGINCG